ncbi:MAG TPA: hypothetical protein VHE99_01145 [Gammaproteobacteria bacterium]|nr:hypothetical protein [Gammaproteobacteria bacterium]
MKSGILGLVLLFTVVSSFAQLKCDAPEYTENPVMHDACVNLQKALDEKIKNKMEKFSEGINKARSRVNEAKLNQAISNVQSTPPQGTAGNIPNTAAPANPAPVQQIPQQPAPAVNYPTQTPTAPEAVTPPAPAPSSPPETAPNKPQNSKPKNIPYY